MTTPSRIIRFALLAGILAGCRSPTETVIGTCCAPYSISLLVRPMNATIAVGITIQMSDTISNNPSNLAYSVWWNSSDTTKATVDSTGLVRGKAASPGIAICATAVRAGFASVENCATVTVQPAPSNFGPTLARSRPRRRGGSP
jgi:hypothetical protein